MVDDLSSLPTVGVGAAGMFLLGLVGVLFRSQQLQIASLREQNHDQALRIDKLEGQLDAYRIEAIGRRARTRPTDLDS